MRKKFQYLSLIFSLICSFLSMVFFPRPVDVCPFLFSLNSWMYQKVDMVLTELRTFRDASQGNKKKNKEIQEKEQKRKREGDTKKTLL